MIKHSNCSHCPKCEQIMALYPVHQSLSDWFWEYQSVCHHIHISEAGRNKLSQDEAVKSGRSKLPFGESAHNTLPVCALDVFFIINGHATWDEQVYDQYLKGVIPPHLQWFGDDQKTRWDLPHIQIRNYRELLSSGILKLIGR